MAEANPWLTKIQCRYFALGSCREGDNCLYLHDGTNKNKRPVSPSNIVCRFYLKGKCSFGQNCRFQHPHDKGGGGGGGSGGGGGGGVSGSETKSKNNNGARSKISTDNVKSQNKTRCKPSEKNTQSHKTKMTPLKKGNPSSAESSDSGISADGMTSSSHGKAALTSPSTDPDKWVKAPEFVPGCPFKAEELSYSGVTRSGLCVAEGGLPDSDSSLLHSLPPERRHLCPWLMEGECPYEEECPYTHGDLCEICGRAVLHPLDPAQNKLHEQECIKEMESDMELSFAVARSKDKTCGICMEVVLDKENPSERRFGLLSDCNHCFCIACIRQWRQAKQFENKVIRSCPECRTSSDFVTPSKYWAEDAEDKNNLIQGYKSALGKKSCRYFDYGRGECPFNDKCFYKHAYPDGRIAEPKPRARRVRHDSNADMELLQRFLLWDFVESREAMLDFHLADVIEELFYGSDSSNSDSEEDYDVMYLHL